MSRLDETIQAKKQKRAELEATGVVAHPYVYNKTHSVQASLEAMGEVVSTAGRIMSKREHGKVTFLTLADNTARIQVLLKEDTLGADWYAKMALIDPSDYIGVTGTVITTKTGEVTIAADEVTLLSKALRSVPNTWQGIDDKEIRFRKRYLDMLINPEAKKVLDARWLVEKEIRRYLQDVYNFTEVETPVLQPLYGGTNARPFTTHMNSLDSDFYLRIAPELYLKRLIVGGYERIFEIARNFRNEGIDLTHQPEFTMMEWYMAYTDYNGIMDVAEGMFKHLASKLNADLDLSGSWPRLPMSEALKHYENIDVAALSDEQMQDLMKTHEIELTGSYSRGKAIFALFDHLVTKKLVSPTWIIDYPKEVSPLAKTHRLDPQLVERFELYIGGKEMADGWSEITDPLEQRARFENEQQHMREGDEEAQPLDEDFLEAMEYGMPPLGGIGIGIDRLVMFLTNTWAIREVIAFPTLRPTAEQVALSQRLHPTKKVESKPKDSSGLPPRTEAEKLLHQYIKNEALVHHSEMVAKALEAYAVSLGEDIELWYQTGLLHDLDWEMFPDEHPNRAISELLNGYPQELKDAIAAHAPDRTGKNPEVMLDKYLFACDELSGLMNAISLMRPNGFADMEVKSVKKKIKDKAFAANVNRDDIMHGVELIGKPLEDHIAFLINIFKQN